LSSCAEEEIIFRYFNGVNHFLTTNYIYDACFLGSKRGNFTKKSVTLCQFVEEIMFRGKGAGFDFRAVFQIDSFDCANRELHSIKKLITKYQSGIVRYPILAGTGDSPSFKFDGFPNIDVPKCV